jgi:hypothetical protein
MRTLLAMLIFAGALAWSVPDADAARRSWRSAYVPHKAVQPRNFRRGNAVCQDRARFFDPNGTFRGFPCWARSAFGQGRR